MPNPKNKPLNTLTSLGFHADLMREIDTRYVDRITVAVADYVDSLKGQAYPDRRLLKSLFYFEMDENQVLLFQFRLENTAEPEPNSQIVLFNNNDLKFYPYTHNNDTIQRQTIRSRLIGIATKSEVSDDAIDKLEDDPRIFPRKLIPSEFTISSRPNDKTLEAALLDQLDEIQKLVKEHGFWVLPKNLQRNFPQLASYHGVVDPNLTEAAKKHFTDNPIFLEKFCYFKIKEIVEYQSNPDKKTPPQSRINLSLLEQTDQQFKLSEAKLVFAEDNEVVTIQSVRSQSFPDASTALCESRWLVESSSETSIRLTNQRLEDSLVIRYLVGKLKYGILANEIIRADRKSNLNFWEDLAANIKARQEKDYSQIELVKRKLKSSNKQLQNDPVLDNDIRQLELNDKDFRQSIYAVRILRNRLLNRGTLLHLPTGYGKTFILLMAMAQIFQMADVKKPFLVVVPMDNVRDSWERNIRLFNEKIAGTKLFDSGRCKYLIGSEAKTLITKIHSEKPHVVVITADLLRNIVGNMLHAIEGFTYKLDTESNKNGRDGKSSVQHTNQNNFIGALNKKRYTQLALCAPISLESTPSIFSPRFFIIGDESTWLKIIEENKEKLNKIAPKRTNQKGYSQEDLINDLRKLKAEQSENTQKYEDFKNSFDGVVLDESHDSLSTTSKSALPIADIVIDFAKTYQSSTSSPDQNKLIVASSATPWPNEMDDLKLHLRFLYARLLGEYHMLNDFLFSEWSAFETALKKENANTEAFDITSLQGHLLTIRSKFHAWVKLLFNHAIEFEPFKQGSTNHSTKKIFMVDCEKTEEQPSPKKGEIFSMLREFYSSILDLGKIPVRTLKKGFNHGVRGNLFSQCIQQLPKPGMPMKKIAFYVALQDDAASLAMALADYYGIEEVFIGFFYEKNFVKDQKASEVTVGKEYVNITFNTERDINRNAFNDIFNFYDFCCFCATQFFHIDKHPLLSNAQSFLAKLTAVLEAVKNTDPNRVIAICQQLKKLGNESTLKPIVEKFALLLTEEADIEKRLLQLEESERVVIRFLLKVIQLADYSEKTIIHDFNTVLEEFKDYLPSTSKGSFKKHYNDMIKAIQDSVSRRTQTWLRDDFIVLRDLVLVYLYKIHLSTILIVGDAGTAGMRLDADIFVMLSSAWTPGKLDQIEGRVGRIKEDKLNKAITHRPCQILQPVTTSLFEFVILSYFIRKFLYHIFITAKQAPTALDICLPLLLAFKLNKFYFDKLKTPSASTICEWIHSNVEKAIETCEREDRNYHDLPPYEKALLILPEEIRVEMEALKMTFSTLTEHNEPLPDTQLDSQPASQSESYLEPMEIDLPSLPIFVTKFWPPEYSEWITAYATSRGWTNDHAFEARPMIAALLPSKTYPLLIKDISGEKIKFVSTLLAAEVTGTGAASETINLQAIERPIHHSLGTCRFDWSDFTSDEFYIELPTNITVQLQLTPLQINTVTYYPFALLCGGANEDTTHFWTYRLGVDCYYMLDDTNPMITVFPEELLFKDQTRYIRYVALNKLEQLKQLTPKQLKNQNNNCYVHASYQFVETDALRQQLSAMQNIPNLDPAALSVTASINRKRKTERPTVIPEIIPLHDFYRPVTEEQIQYLSQTSDSVILLIVPTRGAAPDLSYEEFVITLQEAIHGINIKIIVMWGANAEEALQSRLRAQLTATQSFSSDSIFSVMAPFLWRASDKWGNLVPLGQMRNFCFVQAQAIWQLLTDANPELVSRIGLMSFDGDTKISRDYLRNIILKSDFSRDLITTAGYEMVDAVETDGDALAIQIQEDVNAIQWKTNSTRLASRINVDINAGLHCDSEYFGYPSEPMTYISPAMLQKLFRTRVNMKSFAATPFGFWNLEGRSLIKYARRALAKEPNQSSLHIQGPSMHVNERPALVNYDRFKITMPKVEIKQRLSKAELLEVLKSIYSQSQHVVKPYLIGSNIAAFMRIKAAAIRHFASYLRINTLLVLLGLGPGRSRAFASLVYECYSKDSFNLQDDYRENIYSVPFDEFKVFFTKNFILKAQTDNVALFFSYARLVAQWAMLVAEKIVAWFADSYVEEKTADNRFIKMELPDDYPRKAAVLWSQDEQQVDALNHPQQVAIASIASNSTSPLEDLCHYIESEITSGKLSAKRLTALQAIYSELKTVYLTGTHTYAIFQIDQNLNFTQATQYFQKLHTQLVATLNLKAKTASLILITLIPNHNNQFELFFASEINKAFDLRTEISNKTVNHFAFTAKELERNLGVNRSLLLGNEAVRTAKAKAEFNAKNSNANVQSPSSKKRQSKLNAGYFKPAPDAKKLKHENPLSEAHGSTPNHN